MSTSAGPLVFTDQLTKQYGRFVALSQCTLGIDRGEVHGLLGPNGAGKTTLIRLLMGFLRPSSGKATVDGWDCYLESVEVHRRVAYVPADAQMVRQMRGRDVLCFFSQIRGDRHVDSALALARRLDLDIDRRVGNMSTGMRQKLALAITLSTRAELLILDEPTANLDPNVRGTVLELVREVREEGKTVLFSSHVLSEIEEVCDRVTILRQGELVHQQRMADLRVQHRIRARLVGPFVAPPAPLEQELFIEDRSHEGGQLIVETPGELSPLLDWLASLPLEEVQIEPIGLRAVYDRFHRTEPISRDVMNVRGASLSSL